jgi:hypothetical protein
MKFIVAITGATPGIGLTQPVAEEMADAGFQIYAVLPGAAYKKLDSDLGLGREPSELLAAEYVARKIFRLAEGKTKSGQSIRSNPEQILSPSSWIDRIGETGHE